MRRNFSWAVANELVDPSVLHGLRAVAGLRFGRSDAKETAPVKPVPDAFVDAVLPYASPQVAAMIRLQRLCAMRSGEVVLMRACDIDTREHVWAYTSGAHKTSYLGHTRQIFLGPQAQSIIEPFFKTDLQAFLFSPTEAEAERARTGHKPQPHRHTPTQCLWGLPI